MPRTRNALIGVLSAIAILLTITTVPALADPLEEAKGREMVVRYSGLVVTTMAAAEATGNMDFWNAATDAAATTSDPVGTLLRLMETADWADEAVAVWRSIYGGIDLEEAYSLTIKFYAEQRKA